MATRTKEETDDNDFLEQSILFTGSGEGDEANSAKRLERISDPGEAEEPKKE